MLPSLLEEGKLKQLLFALIPTSPFGKNNLEVYIVDVVYFESFVSFFIPSIYPYFMSPNCNLPHIENKVRNYKIIKCFHLFLC